MAGSVPVQRRQLEIARVRERFHPSRRRSSGPRIVESERSGEADKQYLACRIELERSFTSWFDIALSQPAKRRSIARSPKTVETRFISRIWAADQRDVFAVLQESGGLGCRDAAAVS